MHPRDFFATAPAVEGGQCFAVMPFATDFDVVYDAIKNSLEVKELGLICTRADELVRGGTVMLDVLRGLARAELVIVDITRSNANVFYELGIAHSVRCAESIVLITQNIKDIPFDVQPYRCIEYVRDEAGLRKLGATLASMVENEVLPTRFVFRMTEGEARSSDKVMGEDRDLYSFKICEVIPARDSAQFRLEVFRHRPGAPTQLVYSDVQPALQPRETVPIPKTHYALKLDESRGDLAVFCVCRPESSSRHADRTSAPAG